MISKHTDVSKTVSEQTIVVCNKDSGGDIIIWASSAVTESLSNIWGRNMKAACDATPQWSKPLLYWLTLTDFQCIGLILVNKCAITGHVLSCFSSFPKQHAVGFARHFTCISIEIIKQTGSLLPCIKNYQLPLHCFRNVPGWTWICLGISK